MQATNDRNRPSFDSIALTDNRPQESFHQMVTLPVEQQLNEPAEPITATIVEESPPTQPTSETKVNEQLELEVSPQQPFDKAEE